MTVWAKSPDSGCFRRSDKRGDHMKRGSTLLALATTAAMIGAALTPSALAQAAGPSSQSKAADRSGALHHVYTATVDPKQLGLIRASGVDREDLHGLGQSGKG